MGQVISFPKGTSELERAIVMVMRRQFPPVAIERENRIAQKVAAVVRKARANLITRIDIPPGLGQVDVDRFKHECERAVTSAINTMELAVILERIEHELALG